MNIINTIKENYISILQKIIFIIKLVILDQITKWWFISNLKIQKGMTINVTPFLEIVYTWNYGISFGIFTGYNQYSNYVFIIINSFITAYICFLLFNCKNKLESLGYLFIIGGAIGNLIDRIWHGAVFDFLYLHYKNYSFFVFNLADAFISIGGALIIYSYYKHHKNLIELNKKIHYDSPIENTKLHTSSKN